MGGRFITSAIVVGGGFKGILVLMHLGLWRNNLNNFLPKALSVMLILLTSSITSSLDCFLGICSHPYFVTQSNVSKAIFTIVFGVFSNASTFPSSCSSCPLFGVLISVDC
jgi:hypothetical protein